MARRFEDDVLVTVFEVDTDEWLKEVQVGSGQNSNCPCDFCSPGNDDKLGRVRRLVFDRFFNRRYGKVVYVANVLRDGIVLRWSLVCLMKMFFQKIVGWFWLLREGIVVIC